MIISDYRRYLTIFAVFFEIILFLCANLYAGEKETINLVKSYLHHDENYNAITELLRYRYLYPRGEFYSQSIILTGKAYFKGGNYGHSSAYFSRGYKKYPSERAGQEGLYFLGYIRLLHGSPFLALNTFREYRYVYKDGEFKEKTALGICYSLALTGNFKSSLSEIGRYKKEFPGNIHSWEVRTLEKEIKDEMNRPEKSVVLSTLGSLVIPGFGHFYTGSYGKGFLALFTNALCIYLMADGFMKNNLFQGFFFTFVEASFYQYSLYSAVREVREYNSRKGFNRRVRLSIQREF
ncbi:tol-pal system YbgF family protein [Spirochaetota bacterium]